MRGSLLICLLGPEKFLVRDHCPKTSLPTQPQESNKGPSSPDSSAAATVISSPHQLWHLCCSTCSSRSTRTLVLTNTTALGVYGLRFGGKCESDPAAPRCLCSLCGFCGSGLPAHGFLLVFAPNIIPTATRGLLCLNVNICGLGGKVGGVAETDAVFL